jgi:hypothetical protein
MPAWERQLLQKIEYTRLYLANRGRPRNYDQYGLVKHT